MKNSDTNINKYFEQAKEVNPVISNDQARGLVENVNLPANSTVKKISGKQAMSYIIPTASAAAIVVMAMNGVFSNNPGALVTKSDPKPVSAIVKTTPQVEEPAPVKESVSPNSQNSKDENWYVYPLKHIKDPAQDDLTEKTIKPSDVKGITIMNLTRAEAEKLGMKFEGGNVKLAAFRNTKNPLMISLDKNNIAAKFSPEANGINSITPKFISNTDGSKSFSLLKTSGYVQKEVYGGPNNNIVASRSNFHTSEGSNIQTSIITSQFAATPDNLNSCDNNRMISINNGALTISSTNPTCKPLQVFGCDSNAVSMTSSITINTNDSDGASQVQIQTLNSGFGAPIDLNSFNGKVVFVDTEKDRQAAFPNMQVNNLFYVTNDSSANKNFKFDFNFEGMDEAFKRMDEKFKKMDEDFKKFDENFKQNFKLNDTSFRTYELNINEGSELLTLPQQTINMDNNKKIRIYNTQTDALSLDKIDKINNLVAVGVSVNSDDVIDYVVWFEPGEEFLNKIPERYREKLAPELAEINKNTNVCESSSVIKGEKYMDSWRACSGAIENLSVYPNPTKGALNVNFNLNQDRLVSLAVHDLFGKRIYELDPEQKRQSGVFNQRFELKDLQPGMYLIVAQTDQGETAVQRFIVE